MDTSKTSLISIATILTGVGGAILGTNLWAGVVVLALAVGVLVLREYLKAE